MEIQRFSKYVNNQRTYDLSNTCTLFTRLALLLDYVEYTVLEGFFILT
jgi:hypothetical protein